MTKNSDKLSNVNCQFSIFLVGFMGCGKTTYGKPLAELLGVPFFDLDDEIEAYCGKKIPEIFTLGESIFRNIEREVLHRVATENESFVLACGGGTPCFGDNMAYINSLGTSVYLKCSVDELYNNILLSNPNRPLLQGKRGNDLRAHIKTLLAPREKFYEQAKLILTSENHSPQKICEQIKQNVSK